MNQRNLLSIIAVIGALLVSGCGDKTDAKQNSSHSVEQQPQKEVVHKTKELISFKGIPLGKPGIKDALEAMCLENKTNIKILGRDACSFKNKDEPYLIWVNYGNLQGEYQNALGVFYLGSGGELNRIKIESQKVWLLDLVVILEEKYGKPEKIQSTVENRMGTKFENDTFVWVDDQGSRITVESIYSKVDEGRIIIESASSIAAQDAAGKMAIQAIKSNL